MEERMRAALPYALRRPLFGLLGRVYPKADWAPRVLRAKTTFEGMARSSVEAYFHSVSILRGPMRAATLQRAHSKRSSPATSALEVFTRHAAHADTDDPLALIQYLDLKTYLVGDINTKVDRASMAHSLEVREPLMDHPLVEWLATLPSSLKLRGSEGKLSAEEGDGAAPARRRAVPAEDGLRGAARALVPRAVEAARARCGARRRAWRAPAGSTRATSSTWSMPTSPAARDYSAPLWTLLMFEAFLRNVVDAPASMPMTTRREAEVEVA